MRARFAGALALVAALGCAKKDAGGGAPGGGTGAPGQKPPVSVRVAKVTEQPAPVDLRAIGHVDPLATVGIRAQVGGVLEHVHFREGDEVQAGALLFTIDPRPYEAALAQAQANLARDEAQAERARSDARRLGSLVSKGYVTQQQAQQASAEAKALGATLRADKAAVEAAELNLQYCRIRAPFGGRIGRLLVREGNLVKANADTPMVTLNQIRPIAVSFALPARDLPEIQEHLADGPMAVLARPPGATRGFRGALDFVDNAVDPATGTIGLRATFLNEDEALWPGEPVDVTLTIAVQPKAIVAPSAAIQAGQQGSFAWVVKPDNTAEQRQVQTDRALGDRTVVTRGLSPGELVVTDGSLGLSPGARVQVREEPQRAPDRTPRGREAPR